MSARIVVTGNAATPPDHKVTSTGRSRTVFRIGSTERRLDRETGAWVDGDQFFIGVTCWGALADNVFASVKLGTPVVVSGRIAQRSFTDKDEQLRFTYEVTADTVAPDLTRGTAAFTRVSRVNGPPMAMGADGLPAMGVGGHPDDADASSDPAGGAGEAEPGSYDKGSGRFAGAALAGVA